MTRCQRGCCWTRFEGICARSGDCQCHPTSTHNYLGTPQDEAPNRLPHRDPTANQAIGNISKGRRP